MFRNRGRPDDLGIEDEGDDNWAVAARNPRLSAARPQICSFLTSTLLTLMAAVVSEGLCAAD